MVDQVVLGEGGPAAGPRRGSRGTAAAAVGAVIAVVLLVAWTTGAFSGSGGPQAAVVDVGRRPSMTDQQLAEVHGADSLARTDPEAYGEAWWDADAGHAALGVVGEGRVARARAALARAGFPGVRTVVVRDSAAHLAALQKALVEAPAPLHGALVSAGPAPTGNRLLVLVEDTSPEVLRQVYAVAGDSAVVGHSAGRFSDAVATIPGASP